MTNKAILKKADILKIMGISLKEYDAIHHWLRYNYGTPERCEHCGKYRTKEKKRDMEWALIRGKLYERKRENYIGLCKSCHQKYDQPKPEWCSVENCNEPYFSSGLCRTHYFRQYYRNKFGKNKWQWKKYEK